MESVSCSVAYGVKILGLIRVTDTFDCSDSSETSVIQLNIAGKDMIPKHKI
jgi:hypothetical protein